MVCLRIKHGIHEADGRAGKHALGVCQQARKRLFQLGIGQQQASHIRGVEEPGQLPLLRGDDADAGGRAGFVRFRIRALHPALRIDDGVHLVQVVFVYQLRPVQPGPHQLGVPACDVVPAA